MCLSLVRNGVPFDVAFSLDPLDRMAYNIIFGELDGNVWSWSRMRWEPK
jgi:hypothetical protein